MSSKTDCTSIPSTSLDVDVTTPATLLRGLVTCETKKNEREREEREREMQMKKVRM